MDEHDLKGQMISQADKARIIKQSPGGLEKWIGHTVKKGFSQVSMPHVKKEWMWVDITGVQGNQLVGTLLNEPVLATYLRHGDSVTLTEDEIIAVYA